MGQWENELAAKAGGSLKVLQHHGPQRTKSPANLVDNDVVLVTYQTLGSDFNKGGVENGRHDWPPCGSIHWHRIVLDESHYVKNPAAKFSKACVALAGQKR